MRMPMGTCDFSVRPYSYDDWPNDFELKNFTLAEEDVKMKVSLAGAPDIRRGKGRGGAPAGVSPCALLSPPPSLFLCARAEDPGDGRVESLPFHQTLETLRRKEHPARISSEAAAC